MRLVSNAEEETLDKSATIFRFTILAIKNAFDIPRYVHFPYIAVFKRASMNIVYVIRNNN